jgi:hypothetical protein
MITQQQVPTEGRMVAVFGASGHTGRFVVAELKGKNRPGPKAKPRLTMLAKALALVAEAQDPMKAINAQLRDRLEHPAFLTAGLIFRARAGGVD